MPLYIALSVLVAVACALMAWTAAAGLTLDGQQAMMSHFALGLATSIVVCFIHVLCLFYFIGTGKDIREAVAEEPDLCERFLPWTRQQKRRVFPLACLAIALMIFATLMGGEVHSRLLGVDGGRTLPFRGVTAWWLHGLSVLVAMMVSIVAFLAEIRAVRDNRRAIEEINAALERRQAPDAGG
jgi:uncharacterized BrkB/YihY/UPF0761 family membrane protein